MLILVMVDRDNNNVTLLVTVPPSTYIYICIHIQNHAIINIGKDTLISIRILLAVKVHPRIYVYTYTSYRSYIVGGGNSENKAN